MVHALSPKRRRHTGRRGGQPFVPQEHDQLAQGGTAPTPSPEVQRAYEDLRQGRIDADQGPLLDHACRKLRSGGSGQ